MTLKNTEAAALGYLSRGWSVVPVRSGEKRPLVHWEEFQYRHATKDEVVQWYRRWPDAGVAIVCGMTSGLIVLDVDPRHGGDDSLEDLERTQAPLPHSIEAITGGGGRHIYFAHPGGTLFNRVGLVQGIDLRGDGGIIIAPPSLHASGRRYEWEVAHHPDETALAPMPAWLLALARGISHAGYPGHPGHPRSYWRQLVRDGVPEGARNNTIASFAGHLLWHGVDPEVITELLLCWNAARCRPPLAEDEVKRTIESIQRTQERHRTTNSAPRPVT